MPLYNWCVNQRGGYRGFADATGQNNRLTPSQAEVPTGATVWDSADWFKITISEVSEVQRSMQQSNNLYTLIPDINSRLTLGNLSPTGRMSRNHLHVLATLCFNNFLQNFQLTFHSPTALPYVSDISDLFCDLYSRIVVYVARPVQQSLNWIMRIELNTARSCGLCGLYQTWFRLIVCCFPIKSHLGVRRSNPGNLAINWKNEQNPPARTRSTLLPRLSTACCKTFTWSFPIQLTFAIFKAMWHDHDHRTNLWTWSSCAFRVCRFQ